MSRHPPAKATLPKRKNVVVNSLRGIILFPVLDFDSPSQIKTLNSRLEAGVLRVLCHWTNTKLSGGGSLNNKTTETESRHPLE